MPGQRVKVLIPPSKTKGHNPKSSFRIWVGVLLLPRPPRMLISPSENEDNHPNKGQLSKFYFLCIALTLQRRIWERSVGELFRPLFIMKKGTNWVVSEEFGNVRAWQANYGCRQQIQLFDRSSWQNISGFLGILSQQGRVQGTSKVWVKLHKVGSMSSSISVLKHNQTWLLQKGTYSDLVTRSLTTLKWSQAAPSKFLTWH